MRISKVAKRLMITCTLIFAGGLFIGFLAKSIKRPAQHESSKTSTTQNNIQLTTLVPSYEYGRYGFMDIAIINRNEFWGVGYDGQDSRRIYYSKDGGHNWEIKQLTIRGFGLNAITFADAQHGWAVGGYGTVLRTTNGGQTWEELNRPTTFDLTEVQFINSQVGYIAGREWFKDPDTGAGTYRVEILRTDDGGQNWRTCYRNDESGNVFQMALLSESILVASIDSNTLIRTSDGGETWQIVATGKGDFVSVVLNSDGSGWTVGHDGSFYKSADQGKTWLKFNGMSQRLLHQNWVSIDFADTKKGMVIGEDGAIAITDDGGLTWVENATYIKEHLGKVRLHDTTGIILGSQKVYRVDLDMLPE